MEVSDNVIDKNVSLDRTIRTFSSVAVEEFERVLTENGVANDTVQTLKSNGLKTMYIFLLYMTFHRRFHEL